MRQMAAGARRRTPLAMGAVGKVIAVVGQLHPMSLSPSPPWHIS